MRCMKGEWDGVCLSSLVLYCMYVPMYVYREERGRKEEEGGRREINHVSCLVTLPTYLST
jgi:hypothetical protein